MLKIVNEDGEELTPDTEGLAAMLRAEIATCLFDRDDDAKYREVLEAEPHLRPVPTLVDALCELVRADDRMCATCVWEAIVKPLVSTWIGCGRGYPPEQAKDSGDRGLRILSLKQLLESGTNRIEPTTDTERWLRTADAFDAFTDPLLRKLQAADPGNGHGVKRDREAGR